MSGQRFAHELGHSLNMDHDMGKAGCQNIGGIMDYYQVYKIDNQKYAYYVRATFLVFILFTLETLQYMV